MDQTGHVQVIVVRGQTIVASTGLVNRIGVFPFLFQVDRLARCYSLDSSRLLLHLVEETRYDSLCRTIAICVSSLPTVKVVKIRRENSIVLPTIPPYSFGWVLPQQDEADSCRRPSAISNGVKRSARKCVLPRVIRL
jgi:hypothetical protein